MIQLHDRTRRRIALAVFFSFGLMPTLAVSAWGVWWRSSWYVARQVEQLALRMGMEVRLSGVRHPEPGVVIYEKIEVLEPENHQPVFGCEEAEVRRSDSSQESNAPGLRLILSQPRINALQWGEIWRLADHLVTGRAEIGDTCWQVEAKELGLKGRGISHTLSQILVQVESLVGGPQIKASFRLPGEESQPARILVTRDRKVTPPVTRLDIDASATPLPCSLLAISAPAFESLGPRSWFSGTLRASLAAGGPNGELVGKFARVDLERLSSDHLPHQLIGTADITVERVYFREGRLSEADVLLVGGPGTISRSLLDVAEQLGIAASVTAEGVDLRVPYENLAMWLACDAKRLRVRAMSPSGVMLAGRSGPILRESSSAGEPLALETVKQALAPNAESFVRIASQPASLTRPPRGTPKVEPDADNPLR